ncbi:MAG: DUF5930 domain-containing protein [Paracoccaceae bacterium]
MLTRLAYRINSTLERWLPEQRLFLKSDKETRFIRLRPATQAIAVVCGGVGLTWTVVATAIILMDSISAGSSFEQVQRQQATFESRLNTLSLDRDTRAEEAVRAQDRFNLALAQVAEMQGRLLASEDRRRELETGIDVIQNTLRRTIQERDDARDEAQTVKLALAKETGTTRTGDDRARDVSATLAIMSDTLGATATERDQAVKAADRAAEAADQIAQEKRILETRNDEIFSKLEEAVTVSMEPMDKIFREAGLSSNDILKTIRRGYSGQGGPLTALSLSSSGAMVTPDDRRAGAILEKLDEMNMYRIAAFKLPFAMPVKDSFRWTSGFGYRSDPLGKGTRMHTGTDLAGSYGTPIYATGDGVVIHAGWENGYGRSVVVQHDFGIKTRYGHMSQIRVSEGQKVSRGDRIGDMGNSGRSTGTHLHYEVIIGGKPVNPMTFIKAGNHVF